MTIRIYPSRLPGEPLETHQHSAMTVHQWLSRNVDDFTDRERHPVSVDVNGVSVPSDEWPLCSINPDSDVRIYSVPYSINPISWISTVVGTVFSLFYSAPDISLDSSGTGKQLNTNPAKANTAKLGDPIRELFGRRRIYPDYVVPPVTRFDPSDPTVMRTQMLVCLGVGRQTFADGDIRVGDTPSSSLPGFSYQKYEPGADVSSDERSEIWFNSTEVGGTTSGNGLDMAQTAPESDDINADSMSVSGSSISFIGLDTDDDDDDDDDDENALPSSWVAGAVVEIQAPTNFQITTSTGYSVISGKLLTEIAPYSGMPVITPGTHWGRLLLKIYMTTRKTWTISQLTASTNSGMTALGCRVKHGMGLRKHQTVSWPARRTGLTRSSVTQAMTSLATITMAR